MDRIQNLRKHATEAANSEFLWNLGFLAPSRRKAYDVCIAWGLSEKDQKRVTSVTALRDQAPEALEEIRRAAFPEENKMVEVLIGPRHYELEAKSKDEALWRSITKRLGIRSYLELREEIEVQRFPITTPTTASDLEEKLPRVVWHDAFSPIHFVGRPKVRITSHGTPILEILPYYSTCPGHAVISVWPAWPRVDGREQETKDDQNFRCQPQNPAPWFYWPEGKRELVRVSPEPYVYYHHTKTINHITGPRWCDAVVSTNEKRYLGIAKRIASAYEQETARRRKPAKAFVLKNY